MSMKTEIEWILKKMPVQFLRCQFCVPYWGRCCEYGLGMELVKNSLKWKKQTKGKAFDCRTIGVIRARLRKDD